MAPADLVEGIGRRRVHWATSLATLDRYGRPMSARKALAIAAGGILGSAVRWAVIEALADPTGFPWPVFAINVAGSALLGAALAEEWAHPRARILLHDVVAIGFCGGLTTFSTFAVEVAGLGRAGRPELALVYVLASVVAGVAAGLLGAGMFRHVDALRRPVEGEP